MAEMVPDRIPNNASAGEKRLFSILQRLPDDYIVYYEPVIENRYPDFIVICPDMGLMVIEVKGWYPKQLITGDSNNIVVADQAGPASYKHPVRQARDYMCLLMDKCKKSVTGHLLMNKDGEFANRFIFPFGHFAILSNITTEQLKTHEAGDMTSVFSPEKTITRDVLDYWDNKLLTAPAICSQLRKYFDPFWAIEKLTASQVDALRAIIHPEIIIEQPALPALEQEIANVKVLDLKQENNARHIGSGHRLISGIAGSGKTVLLIARARILSEAWPNANLLMLCYNVSLAEYLRHCLGTCTNLTVLHFDDWAKVNGIKRFQDETNSSLGERLLNALEQGTIDSGKYEAVMVDEAQDFDPSWFRCVLQAMRDPNDGDLIIVGDGCQGIYKSKNFNWIDVGVRARGRSKSRAFDLDKNYRNSSEIFDLATIFINYGYQNAGEFPAGDFKAIRQTDIRPCLVKSNSRAEEVVTAISAIKNLLSGKWAGKAITPLCAEEIGVFYPSAWSSEKSMLLKLQDELKASGIESIWLSNPANLDFRKRVNQLGVKIQTINSAKGLQYKAVIILWADILPRSFTNITEDGERRLFYVALTRPQDYLLISTSGPSKFISEIEESGKVDIYTHRAQNTDTHKKAIENNELKIGSRVLHRKYGQGTVRKLEGSEQDQKVVVWFASCGPKKLLCRFAGLEIIDG